MFAESAREATGAGGRRRRWAAAVAAGGVLSLGLTAALPQAATALPAKMSAKVVKVANRPSIGEMLVTKKGAALYEDTDGPCTGGCLTVWPPLLMPKGATVPKGTTGLGTVAFTGGRLQVTYHGMPLYTFESDSGKSVNGNGVGGFVAATVSK